MPDIIAVVELIETPAMGKSPMVVSTGSTTEGIPILKIGFRASSGFNTPTVGKSPEVVASIGSAIETVKGGFLRSLILSK